MIEWWQDERCLRIQYFCPLLKTPSFPLILSFPHHFRMLKMAWNENNNGGISSNSHSTRPYFIPISSIIQE